jgi:hypothetical protein
MQSNQDPEQHHICLACQGSGYEHIGGRMVYPEHSCPICQGRGFLVDDIPAPSPPAPPPSERPPSQPLPDDFHYAVNKALPSIIDGPQCIHCQGYGRLQDGSTCPVCHGLGRIPQTPSYGTDSQSSEDFPPLSPEEAALLSDVEQGIGQPRPSSSQPSHDEGDPQDTQPALEEVYTLGLGGLTQLPSQSMGGHPGLPPQPATSQQRKRKQILVLFCSALILATSALVAFLFFSPPSGPHNNTTPVLVGTTPPAALAIIGGSEDAFKAKFGQPVNSQISDQTQGTLVEMFSNGLTISIYPNNRSVYGLKLSSGNQSWTRDQAFASCQPFMPSDARLGDYHEIFSHDGSSTDAWVQFGESTLLSKTLPATEFTVSDPKAPSGAFIGEVFANPNQDNDYNVCSLKLGDLPTQPSDSSIHSLQPILVPTPTPGSMAHVPTPTRIPYDVPSPTPGPTETPLPTPTHSPAPTPTPVPTWTPTTVPPTDTPIPPTDTPIPPTDTPTPTDIPTDTPTDTPPPDTPTPPDGMLAVVPQTFAHLSVEVGGGLVQFF